MKKLGKLKLKDITNYDQISEAEQMMIKGGHGVQLRFGSDGSDGSDGSGGSGGSFH